MLRALIAIVVLAALQGHAMADDACTTALNKHVHDWTSIAVPGPTPTGPNQSSEPEHEHDAQEVWYMRSQIRLALCNEGKTHEAMLRMDVVRAWLKLPEVEHPADHRRSYEAAVTCSDEEAA